MSTEHHDALHGVSRGAVQGNNGEPIHDTVAFEPRDVQVRTIYWYLFSLAIATILSFAVAGVFQRVSEKVILDSEPPPLPMRKMMTEQQKMQNMYPPEPRLQGVPGHESDAQFDWREKRDADNRANEQLRWIDRNSGIVQIPVSEAMKLVVANGVHGIGPAAKSADAAKAVPTSAAATENKN
jgi:hypothetical protein